MTQIDQVRAHLQAGKSITPMRALAVYGIFRLAVAINHLRNEGLDIDTVLKWDETGKQYGEYSLRRTIKVGDMVQIKAGHGYGLPNWVRRLRNAQVLKVAPTGALLVRFVRGQNISEVWMMDMELINVGA